MDHIRNVDIRATQAQNNLGHVERKMRQRPTLFLCIHVLRMEAVGSRLYIVLLGIVGGLMKT
jgi:hypothetical protein